jgi:hypothetical protein
VALDLTLPHELRDLVERVEDEGGSVLAACGLP